MNSNVNVGVFLCQCGDKIASYIDLDALQATLNQDPNVAHCEVMPYSCLKPGLGSIISSISQKGVNRIVIAGCEGRLMLKKLETELEPLDIHKGQIDMVNLRGHVAAVSPLSPAQNAQKAAKLIKASVAEMTTLTPSNQALVKLDGPVAIVGDGVASFTAANELSKSNRKSLLCVDTCNPETILRNLHKKFPGERHLYNRLEKIILETVEHPCVTVLPASDIIDISGVTGEYVLHFGGTNGNTPETQHAAAIIACIDAELATPGPGFGYDGKDVISQPEMEERIWTQGVPSGQLVFWINDFEADTPEFGPLSCKNAWSMAQYIRKYNNLAGITILYNEKMTIPLSAQERVLSRKLGIHWVPYDASVYPTLQEKYISFCSINDHVEHEIPWDTVILSPQRILGQAASKTASLLGLLHQEGHFLTGHHARVRPDMIGREETYLAGSARYACDLREALAQGHVAGKKTIEMFEKSENGQLYTPRVVCVVDASKCVGCGQCQELCDCGGISVIEGTGGGLPRIVDPMVCMGGGTCAAACPYNALTLQNNTTVQREERTAALTRQLTNGEFLTFACTWGGLPAADNAGNKGLAYDPRTYIMPVPCVGQIDISVMTRAFMEGAPGVLLVGCVPEECHHSYGLDHAWSRVNLVKKLLTLCGFDRRRIALAHADLNKPEEFVITVESFSKIINHLGPLETSSEDSAKLASMYHLSRYNSRIRFLLSASLRRPWEKTYRGDQKHGLDFDQDFASVLTEELLQTRVIRLMGSEKRAFSISELAGKLGENEDNIGERLWDMAYEGVVDRTFKNHQAFYELH